VLFSRTLCRVLVGLLVVSAAFPTRAAAISVLIFPTDDDRGIDGLLDGNFLCCQLDMGQATVTLTTFEERAALEFALAGVPSDAMINSATLTLFFPVAPPVVNTAQVHGYAGDGVITAADLTVENPLTDFQVNAAGSVAIPLDPSFIQDLLVANEAYAGVALRNVTIPSGVFTFWTVDSGFEQFNPVLELEVDDTRVIPEPGSIALVTTALAACAGRRWRRTHRSPPN
jgi:hypothetical protein